jgi:hypothetical protein
MEMPRPTDAHRRLERIVGRWSGEERLYPSPWDPQGGTALGRIDNRLAMDGFAVVQDYEQERNGVITFSGHCVFRWDDAEQCYILHWFDSTGMPPDVFRGTFEDNVLTATTQGPKGWSRCTFDHRQEGHYSFRMEVSQDGAQWHTFMDGTYTREG